MVDPPTYRAEPGPAFADRLERVLLQRLTAEPAGMRFSRDVVRSDEPGRPDADLDLREGATIMLETEDRLTEQGAPSRRARGRWLLAAAAVAVVVVAFAAVERNGDELDATDGFPNLTSTFVSPRNGFSIKLPDGAVVTPATPGVEDGFDVVDTGLAAVFKGMSTEFLDEVMIDEGGRTVQSDERIDGYLSDDGAFPDGCGVPRSQQPEITIDGQTGRIVECPNRIEATVLAGGKLYVFALSHDRSDARALFDAFVASIDLTPETAVHFPAMTTAFVSATNGFSFKYLARGGLAPATELWDPVIDPPTDTSGADDGPFDGVETGYGAYFKAASTGIPDGVAIDAWVDEHVSPGGCSVPRSQQEEISIDGQAGRIAECSHRVDATVVAGGRLYFFILLHNRSDARAFFDAWVATIDLTPETAAEP